MQSVPITSLQTWFPDQQVVPLWPESQLSYHLEQSYQDRRVNPDLPDRAVFQVSNPELVVFKPEKPNGIGIMLLPGGGYRRVAVDKEGVDSARVLNQAGFTVFVMTYRMPGEGHEFGPLTTLADAQRGLRLARQLGPDLLSVGVLGFSAGGHAAASLATGFQQDIYPEQDEADHLSARPDFCALMYPVISMDQSIAHIGSRTELIGQAPGESDISRFSMEKQVTPEMPPCFLLHASDDDAVSVENSVVFWQALRQQGIATEMHLFEKGQHGFGIRGAKGLPVSVWPRLLTAWLDNLISG